MKNYPLLLPLVAFIIGILVQYFFYAHFRFMPAAFILSFSLLCVLYFVRIRSPFVRMLTDFFIILCFFSLGIINSKRQHVTPDNYYKEVDAYVGSVNSYVDEKEKSFRFMLQVESVYANNRWVKVNFESLQYIEKDSSVYVPSIGDQILFQGDFKEIKNQGNPGEFNYAGFMQKKGILVSSWVGKNDFFIVEKESKYPLLRLCERIRKYIMTLFKSSMLNKQNQEVILAMTIGDKSMLSQDTRQLYALSGASHILAVSGLHVGAICLLLGFVLRIIPDTKVCKWLRILIILSFVWCYAFVAGLKSGVLRSAIMVSVFTLGYYNDRGANLLNTLIVAAFAALIANPYFVFDTGFQLSYLAVWGIVVFFPLLKAAIRINIPIVKYFLELTFVGICAQIAVFPVLLKSFGVFSFSGVFFGSLVVSAGTIVLYSSVFLLILSPITKLFQFGIGLLDKMMDLFHLMLSKIGSFDVLIIKDIPVRNYQVFFLIFIIVILSRVLNNLNPKGIIRLGVVLSLFFMSIVFEDLRVMNQGQKLCFYNSRDYELHTGFITQSRNIIYAADSLSENMMQVFENHLLSNNIREQREGLTGCVDSDLVIKADKVLKNSILSCFGSKYVLFFKDRSPYIRPLNKMHIDYIFCKYLSDYTYRYLKENYIFEKIVCYLDYRQKDGSESDVEMHVSRDVHCLKDEGAFIVCLDERVK